MTSSHMFGAHGVIRSLGCVALGVAAWYLAARTLPCVAMSDGESYSFALGLGGVDVTWGEVPVIGGFIKVPQYWRGVIWGRGGCVWRVHTYACRLQRGITLPTWPIVGVAATWWLVSKRPCRRTPGTCKHCGYSLRGNVSERCPECGFACMPDKRRR